MATARRPVEVLTCSAAASHASSLREAITTSAPASARVWTMARPMPRDPPVTTATLPVRSCSAAAEACAPPGDTAPFAGEVVQCSEGGHEPIVPRPGLKHRLDLFPYRVRRRE